MSKHIESADDFAYQMSCLVYLGTNVMGDEFADFDSGEAAHLIDERDRMIREKALEDAAQAIERIGPRVSGDAIRSLLRSNERSGT